MASQSVTSRQMASFSVVAAASTIKTYANCPKKVPTCASFVSTTSIGSGFLLILQRSFPSISFSARIADRHPLVSPVSPPKRLMLFKHSDLKTRNQRSRISSTGTNQSNIRTDLTFGGKNCPRNMKFAKSSNLFYFFPFLLARIPAVLPTVWNQQALIPVQFEMYQETILLYSDFVQYALESSTAPGSSNAPLFLLEDLKAFN